MTAPPALNPLPAVGSLVRARGRDWVVLPGQERDVLRLRPLTGTEDDAIGVFLPLEGADVRTASFAPPDPHHAGNAAAGLLLRDAARLSIRNGAAPFRSLGRIAVEPRPYQFVPLIMALKIDPVRLLIADDVGVGKTIEAAMIARELLDRGVARRLAVICPAHLCEQWQSELHEKFAIEAKLVQSATIGRLERDLPRPDLSLFQYYPHLVISIDYVKSERNRLAFLQHAPDLVIVDEVHMAARPPGGRLAGSRPSGRSRHQRYEFLRALAAEPARNLILVSATPHSGIAESFHSLLGLLDPTFDINERGEAPNINRRTLIPHVVQRRRSDVERWLGTETPFPARRSEERSYTLSPAYQSLYEDVLAYCRESIQGAAGLGRPQQRVRHWAAIALLRCVLSSPEAAVSALSERARRQDLDPAMLFESEEEIDAAFRPQVLDPVEEGDSGDYVPSAPLEQAEASMGDAERRRQSRLLKAARALGGPENDHKLAHTITIVREMLRGAAHPIVFCRYIATAEYVAAALRQALGKEFSGIEISAVTSRLADEQRREEIGRIATHPRHVLVATDCLSEGINLQDHFDAVVHYDLPWNPNRLEQREGRIDRFGQLKPEVHTVVLYGADNEVDRVVLDVLIRKARAIRRQLGIAVPVPADAEGVVQAVVDTVLLRGSGSSRQLRLGLDAPEVSQLHLAWEGAAERERKQRAYFAQEGIQPDEVAREIDQTIPVLGSPEDVHRFIGEAAQRLGGALQPAGHGAYDLIAGDEMERALAPWSRDGQLRVTFDPLANETAEMLGRTHDIVSAYADTVLGKALGPEPDERFARCGAILTDAVPIRTIVLLLRLRYLLRDAADEFAEEVMLAAYRRQDGRPVPLEPSVDAAALLSAARPIANMPPEEGASQVRWALDLLASDPNWYRPLVDERVAELHAANNRLRAVLREKPLQIAPHPPDILGCYVLVPGGSR